MLKYIRKNPLVNWLGRNILKLLPSSFKAFKLKWRTSGVIKLQVNNKRFKMLNRCDDGIVDQIYYNLDYPEINDLNQFIKLLSPSSVVFDIGSNTGVYSILSAKTEPKSRIFAIEPNPINLKRLEQNLSLNNLSNVQIIPNAIGQENRLIQLYVPHNDIISDTTSAIEHFSKSTYQGKLKWKKIEVEQFSIDELFVKLKLENLDLIKIDVEGYEIEVLKGSKKILLEKRPKILLETFPDKERQAWLVQFLEGIDYEAFTISESGLIKDQSNFKDKIGFNYMLLPSEFEP